MTATAFAYEPALDVFDDVGGGRPQLRLIHGNGLGNGPSIHAATPVHAVPAVSVEAYRRRRFLALVAMTIAVLVIAQLAGLSLFGVNPVAAVPSADAAPSVHVVLPGDSYGAIAASFGIENPAVAAAQLQAANGGADLVVGQRIVVDLAGLSSAG